MRVLLLPSLSIGGDISGFRLDRKTVAGIEQYLQYWNGGIDVLARRPAGSQLQLGPVAEPFRLLALEADEPIAERHLAGYDVVSAAGDDFRQLSVSALCSQIGTPCIYTVELTPKTRRDICRLEQPNPLRRWRTFAWLHSREKERRKAFRLASGLQTNGIPAFAVYEKDAPNIIAFFDTRASSTMQITGSELTARLSTLMPGTPLRLAFSGRLNKIKGADHLILVARHLSDMGVSFTLDIFGEGPLRETMEDQARSLTQVRIHGPVDFATKLMPFVKSQIDLFVCCHPQGDPSCTYLETFSCGVPIVGYANEALQGFPRGETMSWTSPMGDYLRLAEKVHEIARRRSDLIEKSKAALAFAQNHSMEAVFKRRVVQWQDVIAHSTGGAAG